MVPCSLKSSQRLPPANSVRRDLSILLVQAVKVVVSSLFKNVAVYTDAPQYFRGRYFGRHVFFVFQLSFGPKYTAAGDIVVFSIAEKQYTVARKNNSWR